MAAASFTLKDSANADVVFSLVGSTPKSAQYKLVSRALSLPLILEFLMNIGDPQSLANDKYVITLRNTVNNTGSQPGKSTGSLKCEISIPRDASWTNSLTQDLLQEFCSIFLASTGAAGGRVVAVSEGIVPTT